MSLFDLSGEVAAFATDNLTVTRAGAEGYDANGRRTSAGASSFVVAASVQPATSRQLQRLPEGFRERDGVAVFCATELRMRDRIAYRGVNYEVAQVDGWNDAGGYCEAVAVRMA